MRERFSRFEEGLRIISHLLRRDSPLTFEGKFYHLKDAVLLPRPRRPAPILTGGNGEKRTLRLVAYYAGEWNATFQTSTDFARLNTRLDELVRENGRPTTEVRRSMMTGCVFGKNDAALGEKIAARRQTFAQLRERGIIVGNASQVTEQLGQLAQAGLQRVMLQWLDLYDIDGLEALSHKVLSILKRE